MKKILLIPILLMVVLCGCKKDGATYVNNNYGNTTPSFIVQGIENLTMTNYGYPYYYNTVSLALQVDYADSAQQMVTLGLSGLPAGIVIDTTWLTTGYPSFNTSISFYDTTTAGAAPGVYTLTLTATGAVTGVKKFPFKLTIKNPPPCTSEVVGKYLDCSTCSSGYYYADSVYADATVENKIWFTNFYNTGALVYGTLICATGEITIPSQTAGSNTYSGYGNFGSHYISIGTLYVNGLSGCYISEN